MGFFLQLRLLIWKNFQTRKRQKIRCLIELIWPLFLFAILMWVRTRGLKLYVHDCHFQSKAMPSSGEFPFLQGFFCGFNNTCFKTEQEAQYDTSKINHTIFKQILHDIRGILFNKTNSQELKSLTRVTQDIIDLNAVLQNTTQDNNKNFIPMNYIIKNEKDLNEFIKRNNINLNEQVINSIYKSDINLKTPNMEHIMKYNSNIKQFLCDDSILESLLKTDDKEDIINEICHLSTKEMELLASEIPHHLNYLEWFRTIQTSEHPISLSDWIVVTNLGRRIATDFQKMDSYNDLTDVFEKFSETVKEAKGQMRGQISDNPLFNNFLLIQSSICGTRHNNILDQIAQGGSGLGSLNSFQDQIKSKVRQLNNYVPDPDISDQCNNLFELIETNPFLSLIWKQIKPFITGKILFTPNGKAITEVMQRVNQTFEILENVKNFNKSSNESIKNYATIDKNIETLKAILNNNASSILKIKQSEVFQTLNDRMDSLNSTNLRETGMKIFLEFQNNISQLFDCFELNKVEGYATEKEAMERANVLQSRQKLWALVVFKDEQNNKLAELPPFVTYKIRMDSDRVDNTNALEDRADTPGPRRRPSIDLKYISFGFAYLQDMIEKSIVVQHTGNVNTPGIILQQFPYPCHIIDQFIRAISRTFPMFMVLSWVYSCSMTVKAIVYEKEHRLKETMRVMGLNNGVHWVGWFLDAFVMMLLTNILLTIILVEGNILYRSNPIVIFIFLLCFSIATIMKSFLISVFFSRANLAAAAGGILFFMMYLPYPFMIIWEKSVGWKTKMATSLLSNVGFGFGCNYLAMFEEMGVGAQWDNIATSPVSSDHFGLLGVMGMLLLDSVLYFILTWYIEAVFPGEYGIAKPWYFPFQHSYWFTPHSKVRHNHVNGYISSGSSANRNRFEEEPQHLKLGVSIHNLRKIYSNGKEAIQNLSLNFYQDQITSFLGHNGAGKTTTISILTGLFPPTSGSATINGFDIRTEMDNIRSSLGICPQYNVLFSGLTVEEHLWFYARLKGRPADEIKPEIIQMLDDLGLPDKKNALAHQLSGGMQRKLSIASAYIGGSKTVILDEPTSGVDPFSRRSIWELLLKYKSGRTVILTTHFMDEADLLGDRIAIIASGNLKCCGSSLFLKSMFGNGYYLTVERRSSSPRVAVLTATSLSDSSETSGIESSLTNSWTNNNERPMNQPSGEKMNAEEVSAIVRTGMPNAELIQQLGTELVYMLPDRQNTSQLEELFKTLDENIGKAGIDSYGLSDTTLEEIFLTVVEQDDSSPDSKNKIKNELGSKRSRLWNHYTSQIYKHLAWNNRRRKHKQENDSHIPNSTGTVNPIDLHNARIIQRKQHNNSTQAHRQVVIKVGDENVKYLSVPTTEVSLGIDSEGTCDEDDEEKGREKKRPLEGNSFALKFQQYKALQIKRFHRTRRNPKAIICELIMPALFVCMALGFTTILPKINNPPPLIVEPWNYGPPNYVFFNNEQLSNMTISLEKELIGSIGMGTRCVRFANNSLMNDECVPKNLDHIGDPKMPPGPMQTPDCNCDGVAQQCPEGAGGPEPPFDTVSTGDIMYNLTGRNLSDWLIKTYSNYSRSRYGGYSFGVYNPLSMIKPMEMRKMVMKITPKFMDPALDDEGRFVLVEDLSEDLVDFFYMEDPYNTIKVWFNNKGWTSSVGYMNAAYNLILRNSLPEELQSKKNQYGIRLINHPMNLTQHQMTEEIVQQSGVALLHAISVIFALSFVPASFVLFLIEEKVTNAKHLQLVSGVNRLVYWIAQFSWDLAAYLLSASICICVFLAFREETYISSTNLPGLVLLLILYGWSSIPMMYPAVKLFSIPSSAFVALACGNMFIGVVTTVATFVLTIFDDEELQHIASIIQEVFLIFPHFCLGHGLMRMATAHLSGKVLQTYGIAVDSNILEWGYLGKNLLSMTILGIVFFAFDILLEYQFFGIFSKMKRFVFRKEINIDPPSNLEDDVMKERIKILNTESFDQNIMALRNLTKIYKNDEAAVNQLCLGVRKGECFGLLGLNGAGKTSTFKMLTGEITPTKGDAWIAGFSIRDQIDQARSNLGYCPQFDALDPLLTVREHLELYSRIRGIPKQLQNQIVDGSIKRLGLINYADRTAGTLSGGNKRKLSTAIALIGNPSLVFLDEPTSGMDPKARRFLWSCIVDIIREGRSVVLTSHSMEECEALCTKLTIMVNGEFKCLGSSQHLKNKFGQGYTLTLRCPVEKIQAVMDFVFSRMPSAKLRDVHHNQIQFQLNHNLLKLAFVFKTMEVAKGLDLIQDYSVSQTTLEEVFLRFATDQKTNEKNKKKVSANNILIV